MANKAGNKDTSKQAVVRTAVTPTPQPARSFTKKLLNSKGETKNE